MDLNDQIRLNSLNFPPVYGTCCQCVCFYASLVTGQIAEHFDQNYNILSNNYNYSINRSLVKIHENTQIIVSLNSNQKKMICVGLLENISILYLFRIEIRLLISRQNFKIPAIGLDRTLCTFDRYLLWARLVRIS